MLDVSLVPEPTSDDPWRVLVSGCVFGWPCGVDGDNYGNPRGVVSKILADPKVKAVPFCPEQFSFGTPRDTPNCVGGDGHDVLAGKARVKSHGGEDWTDGMIAAAREMLRVAQENRVHFALLMDISAACAPVTLYDGHRSQKLYRAGPGVCAALLIESGFQVVSQRDFRTLGGLYRRLDPAFPVDPAAIDAVETEWYRTYFGATPGR